MTTTTFRHDLPNRRDFRIFRAFEGHHDLLVMAGTDLTKVPFHGTELLVVAGPTPAETLVVMKPVIDGMGLSWPAQLKKIKAHPVLSKGMAIIAIPSSGGVQDAVAMRLDRLHFWMATVNAAKVSRELREGVVLFQEECADALFARFFGRALILAGHGPSVEVETLSAGARKVVGGFVASVTQAQNKILRAVFRKRHADVMRSVRAILKNASSPEISGRGQNQQVSGWFREYRYLD
jgi:P22_AR N-terminal domain